jgi:hypothetical protein
VTRTGMWGSLRGTVTATETDAVTPLRHRLSFRYPALSLGQTCGGNWGLGLNFNNSLGGLARPGTESLLGTWQEASPAQHGSCHASRVVSGSPAGVPFVTRVDAGFKKTARRRHGTGQSRAAGWPRVRDAGPVRLTDRV